MTAPPEELVAEPIQYDKDLQLMKGLSKLGDCFHLTTVDKHGAAHSRIMGALPFHPVLGYYIGCHAGSAKVGQLESNSHAVLTTYRDTTGDSYTVEAQIVPQTDKQILLATWSPLLAQVGYKGPDDTSRVVLQVNVRKAEYVNVKQFWASLSKK
ncbi:MAG: hypothetical protein EZS28_047815 [Streblomastix strix]|uniref:Pyridoxamine 5'-phosphate oxidase N-terminal domain-containing protein n=1 Tax=Streblomastix strix TaxID=222440 RepID=A0A5J4TEM1_9EUKA|nr:MAG: hypothetical protein EZS28_047815 [Streblomastix strix]